MKLKLLNPIIVLAIVITSNNASAEKTASIQFNQHRPISASSAIIIDENEGLACKIKSIDDSHLTSNQNHKNKNDKQSSISLEYLNDTVKVSFNMMRNAVIIYVTEKVIKSIFNFSNGFSAKNLAIYVSNGTKPFLPFEFANGVKITSVTPSDGKIIYRVDMPIPEHHSQAASLAEAGKNSAITTVCNDSDMVGDLLEREIIIQYDYYDSKGSFFYSFTIIG
jgi:hypothetical protein